MRSATKIRGPHERLRKRDLAPPQPFLAVSTLNIHCRTSQELCVLHEIPTGHSDNSSRFRQRLASLCYGSYAKAATGIGASEAFVRQIQKSKGLSF
jgi:hypothetical protein